MSLKRWVRGALVQSAMGIGALTLALSSHAVAAEFFTLTSSTFKDGQSMPRKVSNTAASHTPVNKNCVGDNVSPQLSWSHAPEGTKSFAILIEEPEGRGGTGTHHFIAYGISPAVSSFAEGELSQASAKFVGGKSSHGLAVYSGPCTVPGPPHHYAFVIIATDFEPRELPASLSREEFMARLAPEGSKSHAKGATSIVGLFEHPID